jgi:uncharacterized protein YjbI with pentapeptide repeats
MVFQEKATQTEQFKNQHRKYFGLTSKNVLQFASSLILPLMLGVFTVVITFEQQKVARQQRLEDKEESRMLRKQDREDSRLQREDDKNESQQLRDQAWTLAQNAQEAQRNDRIDEYRNQVLIDYIKEIGDLLEKKNGSLTSDPLTHTIARAKTLNILRQLDGSRQIHVIRFLCEAGQLTNTNKSTALDISTAELIDIDFRKTGRLLYTGKISFAGVSLGDSTFSEMDLLNVNFSSARFFNVDFSSALLDNVNFSSAWLDHVNFSSARLLNVNFSSASLFNVNFSSARFGNID